MNLEINLTTNHFSKLSQKHTSIQASTSYALKRNKLNLKAIFLTSRLCSLHILLQSPLIPSNYPLLQKRKPLDEAFFLINDHPGIHPPEAV
jgi:hypothetical protein